MVNVLQPVENAGSPRALRAAKIAAALSLSYLAIVLAAAVVEILDPYLRTTLAWPAILILLALPFAAFLILARSGRIGAAARLGVVWGIIGAAVGLSTPLPVSIHVVVGWSGG